MRSKQIDDGKVRPQDLSRRARLWAKVNSNGNLIGASIDGVVADENNEGVYVVDFNAFSLDNCASVASITSFVPGGGIPAGEATTEVAASSSDTIRVGTHNSAGNAAGRGFSLVVVC